MAGDFNSVEELGPEAIDVNLVRSNAKIVLAPLTLAEPHIAIKPTKAETNRGGDNIYASEVTEIELNYWFRELGIKRVAQKCAMDCWSTNHGYAYIGHVEDKEDGYDSTEGVRTENQPQIRHKQPFVIRMSPKDVLVPPGFWDLEEAPWVALVFRQPLRHVVQKFEISDEDVKKIPTVDAYSVSDEGVGADRSFGEYLKSDDARMVRVINIWDKETRKVYVMAQDADTFLEPPKDWPWKVEGFPLAHIRFEDIADEYHGTPTQSFAMPQQKELNAARTSMRKRFNRSKADRFVTDEVDQTTVDNINAAEDGSTHRIPTPSGMRVSDMMHTDPGLPFDTVSLAYGQQVQADLIGIMGVSNEQRGSGDPNVDSATASANIARSVQVREGERGDAVRSFYLTIAKKLWMVLKQFPDVSRSRMIAGERPGQFVPVSYSLKDLHGEFEFDMDFSAMMQDIPATRATRAMLMYKMFRADPLINPDRLIFEVLKTQNVMKPEAWMLHLRSPEEELQLMMQNMPVEAHERDNHEQHIKAHEQQSVKLTQIVSEAGKRGIGPDNPQVETLRAAQVLMTAHFQDHVAKLMRLQGAQKPPGSAGADPNGARADMKQAAGAETSAELNGQPLVGMGGVVN